VAPRSHPNDGRLDILEVEPRMAMLQRRNAWVRLPTASHLPHPLIATSRVRDTEWTFRRPLGLWLDGVSLGRTTSLRVSVIPDALRVWI
jgi:diacylglycerol kinase family enzyme